MNIKRWMCERTSLFIAHFHSISADVNFMCASSLAPIIAIIIKWILSLLSTQSGARRAPTDRSPSDCKFKALSWTNIIMIMKLLVRHRREAFAAVCHLRCRLQRATFCRLLERRAPVFRPNAWRDFFLSDVAEWKREAKRENAIGMTQKLSTPSFSSALNFRAFTSPADCVSRMCFYCWGLFLLLLLASIICATSKSNNKAR